MPDRQSLRLIFLTHASDDAEQWPFYEAFRSVGFDVRVFCRNMSLRYSRRLRLITVVWPKLVWSGFSLANKAASHLCADSIVTAHDHILLLTFKITRCFRPRLRCTPHKLVLHGFIYSQPRSRWLRPVKKVYYRLLFKNTDLVICHSKHEIKPISQLVTMNETRVAAVHFGIGQGRIIGDWWQAYQKTRQDKNLERRKTVIISAGRSSRDYQTLCKAMELLGDGFHCDVVCDNLESMPPHLEGPNVAVHRSVYGNAYTSMIIESDIVVIPLSEREISAGQMVLLHALASGKPIVITDTPTSGEYVQESRFLRLVPPGDHEAIADAVRMISDQIPLSFEDRHEIRKLFENQFSDTAHGMGVLGVYRSSLW